IAFSLILTVLGFTGHLSEDRANSTNFRGNRSAAQTLAHEVAPPSRDHSFLPNAVSQVANLNPFSKSRENILVPASASPAADSPAVVASGASSSQPSNAKPESGSGIAASQGVQDAQALIAAKLAPDLQGMDPQKALDVIV